MPTRAAPFVTLGGGRGEVWHDGNLTRHDTGYPSSSEGEEDDQEEVPFEQKVQFTEKVRRLTNEGLTKLVK